MPDQIDLSLPLQKHILAAILRVPGLMARVRPAIDPDHYPDQAVADILAWSLHHWDEHQQVPSKASLLDVFKADEDAQAVVKRAYKEEVPDSEHIASRIRGYAKHRALRLAVSEAAQVVNASARGEVLKNEKNRPLYTDPDTYIRKLVEKAMQAGGEGADLGEYLHETIEKGVQEVLHPQKRELFYTGVKDLDEAGVSVERGEIGCVLGVAKGGKSHVLLNIALANLAQGHDVVLYNLEIREDRQRHRWYKRIAGPKVDMKIDPEEFVKKLKERFPKLIKGRLLVKRAIAKQFSPADLRAHLAAIQERDDGFKPAVCIVDYVGIMKPEHVFDEQRFNLASLWLDFRAICQQYDMAGWSAAQVNRGGAGVELVTMKDIAECFEIVQHIDIGFSISMTQQEREANQGRFFVFASRNDSDGAVIDFTFDYSRSIIRSVGRHAPTSEKRGRNSRPSSGEESVDAVLADEKDRKAKEKHRGS